MRLEGHDAPVTSLDFAASGTRVVSTSPDDTCRLWDVRRGVQLACLGGPGNHASPYALSDDGRLLAVFLQQGEVRLLDTETGGAIKSLRVGGPQVFALWFSRTGSWIAYDRTHDRTGSVYLRRWQGDHDSFRVKGLKPVVSTSRIFSVDDQWFAAAMKDGTVRVWDLQSREECLCLKDRDYSGSSLLFAASDVSRLFGWGDSLPLWSVDVTNGRAEQVPGDAQALLVNDDLGRQFCWELRCDMAEASICRPGDAEAVAWYPGTLRLGRRHPSGRMWAVADGERLELLRLEGVADS